MQQVAEHHRACLPATQAWLTLGTATVLFADCLYAAVAERAAAHCSRVGAHPGIASRHAPTLVST
eukprot:scaffold5342_cov344-Prasinococcus_capsulatus_cf.AAC.3